MSFSSIFLFIFFENKTINNQWVEIAVGMVIPSRNLPEYPDVLRVVLFRNCANLIAI